MRATLKKYVAGSTSTTFYVQNEEAELLISTDGASSITVGFGYESGTITVTVLANDTIKIPTEIPNTATGLLITVTASTAYRIFVMGV